MDLSCRSALFVRIDHRLRARLAGQELRVLASRLAWVQRTHQSLQPEPRAREAFTPIRDPTAKKGSGNVLPRRQYTGSRAATWRVTPFSGGLSVLGKGDRAGATGGGSRESPSRRRVERISKWKTRSFEQEVESPSRAGTGSSSPPPTGDGHGEFNERRAVPKRGRPMAG